MTYVKWGVFAIIAFIVICFLHYTLPQRDIVQITGTEVTRMDVGNSIFWASRDAGTLESTTRDVRFINTELPNGKPMVYRNEDTAWGWPPYFKFTAGDITAEAQSIARRPETTWVAVTHYGWRNRVFSIFPNILSIRAVDGPDTFLIPWFNIGFFVVLSIVLFLIYRAVNAFKRRNIDPVLEDIDGMIDDAGEGIDYAQQRATAAKSGFANWVRRLLGRPEK